ncbi:MAG: hypothetical protein IJT12_08830 [Paludibacteraceae bacterium]|nr:hypothetical protein [Paludibacteraceae bacterium]
MKTLRYLLVAIVLVFASLSAEAQFTKVNHLKGCTTFGQEEREFQFNSTSAMLVQDKNLGLAEGGAFTTGVSTGTPLAIAGPRRAPEEGDTPPSNDPQGPQENPIGDGVWVMMLLAAGYGVYMAYRRRKAVAQ